MTKIKVAEAEAAMADGAVELDMVVNIGKVLSKDWGYVSADVKAVVDVAHARKAKVKVIFENCFLQDEHKITLCRICGEVNADFVKTSTGFAKGGATLDDVALLARTVAGRIGVKASGGIRDAATAHAMLAAGATRLGTSSGVAILKEAAGGAGPK